MRRIERLCRFRTLRLEKKLYAMAVGELPEQFLVATAERPQVTHHQRVDAVADREFELRHAVGDRQRIDQPAQRHEQLGDPRRHHFAGSHVGDVTAALFAKADQRAAFFRHVARGETRAMAVAPRLAVNRGQNAIGPDPADVPESVLEHALLDCDLRARVQVLQAAAAADAVMPAARLGARR